MLTSAGGILALLQDSPHVRDGASTNEEIRLKVFRTSCWTWLEITLKQHYFRLRGLSVFCSMAGSEIVRYVCIAGLQLKLKQFRCS